MAKKYLNRESAEYKKQEFLKKVANIDYLKNELIRETEYIKISPYEDKYALMTTWIEEPIYVGTEKECLSNIITSQIAMYDHEIDNKEMSYNTDKEIPREVCSSDNEHMVLNSMLQDGSYKSDACFPFDKIITIHPVKQMLQELTESKDIEIKPEFEPNAVLNIRTFKGEYKDEYAKLYLVEDKKQNLFYSYNLNFEKISESNWEYLNENTFCFIKDNFSEAGYEQNNEIIKEKDLLFNKMILLKNSDEVIKFVKENKNSFNDSFLDLLDKEGYHSIEIPDNFDFDYYDELDISKEDEWKSFIRETVEKQVAKNKIEGIQNDKSGKSDYLSDKINNILNPKENHRNNKGFKI